MKAEITSARRLIGVVAIPGDKSVSHRGIMFGAIAEGKTVLSNFLMGEDCFSTMKAFQDMGVEISIKNDGTVEIQGKGLHNFRQPGNVLYVGNSGTTARLLMGILAGQPFESILDGDQSLRKRPMGRAAYPLQSMGAFIEAGTDQDSGTISAESDKSMHLPLTIKGGQLHGIEYTLPTASAQVKSAIILASLYADSPVIIHQPARSRDHTELMLEYFGGRIETNGLTIRTYPAEHLTGRNISIPGDISSAAFFLTAALICPDSHLVLKNVGINPTRTGILDVYRQMGAEITIDNIDTTGSEPVGDISVSTSYLRSVVIEGDIIPRLIDEIPIIALAATQAAGTTVIRDAAELKVKESDRIQAVVSTLRTLGADIEATEDGMVINGPTPLTGGTITCNMDHRIAMMGAIAGLASKGAEKTIIEDGEWVDISFPGFFDTIQKLRC